ncbi:MAG TPA: hypothetical protein VN133_03595 [Humibacter sp.]|nr:hypothetical protein [Humibacter sp.]
MTPPISATEAALLPLTSDEEILDRVAELLERANQRQVWMLFLDDHDVQLPLLIPISDYPTAPNGDEAPAFAATIAAASREIGAVGVVLIWERYAGPAATASDRAWAAAMTEACPRAGVKVRAQLLCHRSGVRLLDAAECS